MSTSEKRMRQLQHIMNVVINVLFYGSLFFVIYVIGYLFFFASFRIPTMSMYPTVHPGDYVLVEKLSFGARLFDPFEIIQKGRGKILRMPTFRQIHRNDILVFHNPIAKDWNHYEMTMKDYMLKRCIALPGDTLYIRNGTYFIGGVNDEWGYTPAQEELGAIPIAMLDSVSLKAINHWTIKDFGPFYLPKKGDVLSIDSTNFRLYANLIQWETNLPVTMRSGLINLDSTPIRRYSFKENYYFMGGDRVIDSQDSRYWGAIPETYIVGNALLVWLSKDIVTGEVNFCRIFRLLK